MCTVKTASLEYDLSGLTAHQARSLASCLESLVLGTLPVGHDIEVFCRTLPYGGIHFRARKYKGPHLGWTTLQDTTYATYEDAISGIVNVIQWVGAVTS